MDKLTIMNQLETAGLLKPAFLNGLISPVCLMHREIYLYINSQKQAGIKTEEAVRDASVHFDMSRSKVYQIIKSFTVPK